MGFSTCSFCTRFQDRWVTVHVPFKSRILLSYNFLGILDMKPTDFQRQMFWGLISPGQVPKVGVPDVARSSEICSIFVRSLPLVDYSTRDGFLVSPWLCSPISMWPFCPLLWRSCSASFHTFCRENCSMGSCKFGLSMGEGELWSSYATILNHKCPLLRLAGRKWVKVQKCVKGFQPFSHMKAISKRKNLPLTFFHFLMVTSTLLECFFPGPVWT